MKIIVIGAGASGLMAGVELSLKGHDVTLIEKNEKVGRKIFITGKGRCNLTNACPKDEFIKNIVTNPKFLLSSISSFDYKSVMDFFTANGVPLEVQRGNRVFPASLKSSDVIDCLFFANKRAGTKMRLGETVLDIKKEDNQFRVITNKDTYTADKVVIATGGLSYPLTGSTGDGYKFANKFGINVIDQVPALCALKIKEKIPYSLDKFTLKNVTLSAKTPKKTYKEFGDLTFYSYGLAGPICLTLSSLINRIDYKDVELSLDLKPAISEKELNQRIIKDIQSKKFFNLRQLLLTYLPSIFYPWFIETSNLDDSINLGDLTKENRNKLVNNLKHLKITYTGLDDIQRATVTSGGIDIKEISSQTMESKKVPGLYFIGEVLDVDAFTGGFNLQIAFSTAMQMADKIN